MSAEGSELTMDDEGVEPFGLGGSMEGMVPAPEGAFLDDEDEGPVGPSQDPDGPSRAAPTAQMYLVLAQIEPGVIGGWTEVGSIQVAPRTRRATVLAEALAEFPQFAPAVDDPPRHFLVIDADNAEAIPVSTEPPEPAAPVLRIGG